MYKTTFLSWSIWVLLGTFQVVDLMWIFSPCSLRSLIWSHVWSRPNIRSKASLYPHQIIEEASFLFVLRSPIRLLAKHQPRCHANYFHKWVSLYSRCHKAWKAGHDAHLVSTVLQCGAVSLSCVLRDMDDHCVRTRCASVCIFFWLKCFTGVYVEPWKLFGMSPLLMTLPATKVSLKVFEVCTHGRNCTFD